MASANEPAMLKLVCERSDGLQKVAYQARSDGPINAGKSPDGVLANLTADKHVFIGYVGPTLRAGDRVILYAKLDAADGLDVSDGVFLIPYWEDGNFRQLNDTDLGITSDFPAASLAGVWLALGAGYTVPANVKSARLGNGTAVISLEDDT